MEASDQVAGLEVEYSLFRKHVPGGMVEDEVERIAGLAMMKGLLSCHPSPFDNPMGARIHKDHERLEGAGPECAGERAAIILALYSRAMDETLSQNLREALCNEADPASWFLLRDSTDWRGHYYGAHLNIRMPRSSREEISGDELKLRHYLLPFLGTSIIWSGQGGIMPFSEFSGSDEGGVQFVFSPRVLQFERLTNLSANNSRGFIATKNLGGKDDDIYPEWGRFEILCDPLLSEYILSVYTGMVLLITRLIANNAIPSSFRSVTDEGGPGKKEWDTVAQYRAVAIDPSLQEKILWEDNNPLTALAVQERYYALLCDAAGLLRMTPDDYDILREFGVILGKLKEDPLALARDSEAWFRYKIATDMLSQEGVSWSDTGRATLMRRGKEISLAYFLRMMSLQTSGLDDQWGLWRRAASSGRARSVFTKEQVERAKWQAPFSRAAVRRLAFLLGNLYGIPVLMEGPGSILAGVQPQTAWGRMRVGRGRDLVLMPDPTGQSNHLYLDELLRCFSEIRSRAGFSSVSEDLAGGRGICDIEDGFDADFGIDD